MKRRRQFLRATGLAMAVGLAGCGAQDDDEPTDGEDTPTETETATDTATETDTATATETTDDETDTETTADETETATATETAAAPDTVALTLDNVGSSAWEVTEDESGTVAPTGEDNPTLELSVGTRYEVTNAGWSFHPLALRAADDSPLLSQDAVGSFEDDSAVEWVDDGDSLAFTMTESLAADVDYYICTVHSSMRGDVAAE